MRNSDDPKYQLYGALWGLVWTLILAAGLYFLLDAVNVI